MDIEARLTELAKIKGAAAPVVSVYLNTRWADEQQRERVRVFLKNELRKARRARRGKALAEDLDWIQSEGNLRIDQVRDASAGGVALFACGALGLREVLPVRVPFANTFVVAETPFLRPLVEALGKAPSTMVVFVDSETARLIALDAAGAGEEVALESDVPGHHRRGGWAQLAQSRYQRHIQDHRERHFGAVVEALRELTDENGVRRIVMAGEPRTITAFGKNLPKRIAERIVGTVPATRYDAASTIVSRAVELLSHADEGERCATVDAVLTEAAKGGKAVAGLGETLEAVARGAVRRLYLLKGFSESGGVCPECGAFQAGPAAACRACGTASKPVDLGEALTDRVVGSGGRVEIVEAHAGLARVGGVAALLRYPL